MSTYYVDAAAGNDANAGTSAGSAWATVGHAAARVAAGDKVYVKAGTYAEQVVVNGLTDVSLVAVNGPGTVTIEAPAGALAVTGHSDHWNTDVRSIVTVTNSTNTSANAYRSARASSGLPPACSGDA